MPLHRLAIPIVLCAAGFFSIAGLRTAEVFNSEDKSKSDYQLTSEKLGDILTRLSNPTLDPSQRSKDRASLRAHAWGIWKEINKDISTDPMESPTPTWGSWKHMSELFDDTQRLDMFQDSKKLIHRPFFIDSRQLPEENTNQKQKLEDRDTPKDIQVMTTVQLNKFAFDFVATNNLNSEDRLISIRDASQNINQSKKPRRLPPTIPDFTNQQSKVIKTRWVVLPDNKALCLPVCDVEKISKAGRVMSWSEWGRRVLVVHPKMLNANKTEITCDCSYHTKHGIKDLITHDQFYWFKLTDEIIQKENIRRTSMDRKKLDAKGGDYALTVAMHVTTKETPDWVWATFWWHDAPSGLYEDSKPNNLALELPSNNYLMDVTLGVDAIMEENRLTNLNQCYKPNMPRDVCANPWLEFSIDGCGTASNCVSCHQLAVWPEPRDDRFNPMSNPLSNSPSSLRKDSDPYFNDKVKLDFMWFLSRVPSQEEVQGSDETE